jgi:hypothetical protein
MKISKISVAVFMALVYSCTIHSQQSYNSNNLLLQAIQQDDFIFIDGNGYSIYVYEKKKEFSEKTVKKLKKKFKIDKSNKGKILERFKNQNLMFEEIEVDDDLTLFRKNLIFQADEKITKLIEISTTLDRDTSFENQILDIIVADEIPKEIFNSWEVDSIRFISRHIQLGSSCQWQNVGNIQCPYNGQMDWSVFSNKKRALEYLLQKIKLTSDKRMSDFISQDSIDVIFEGKMAVADKRVLKIKSPKFLLGGSNELTVYYVLAEVENIYVACTLSHYSNDNNAPDLPPLLKEVMEIKRE